MTSIISKSNFSSKRKNPCDTEDAHSELSEKKTKMFVEEEDLDLEDVNTRLIPDLRDIVFEFAGIPTDFAKVAFQENPRDIPTIENHFHAFVGAIYNKNEYLVRTLVSKLSPKEIDACIELVIEQENLDMIQFFLNMDLCLVEWVRLLSCRNPEKTNIFFYFFDRFDRKNKEYLEEAIHHESFEIAAFLIRFQVSHSVDFVVRELVRFGEDEENILDLLNFDKMPYHRHLQYINESVDNNAFDIFVKLLKVAPKCVVTRQNIDSVCENIDPSSEPSFRQHLEKLYIRV